MRECESESSETLSAHLTTMAPNSNNDKNRNAEIVYVQQIWLKDLA